MNPFKYPDRRSDRRHAPFYPDSQFQYYRRWLSDEFVFRCPYCLWRDQWDDMRIGREIDHIEPKSLKPELKNNYQNLAYACAACNRLKGSKLVPDPCRSPYGEMLTVRDNGIVEIIGENTKHREESEAARILDARRILEVFKLNRPTLCRLREIILVHKRAWLTAQEEAGCSVERLQEAKHVLWEHEHQHGHLNLTAEHFLNRLAEDAGRRADQAHTAWTYFVRLMAYPDSLPNLTQPPDPADNGKPGSWLNSYHQRREQRELHAWYEE